MSQLNKNEIINLKYKSDKPLEPEDKDELDRGKFVKQLGEGIIQYNNTDSLALGLYGEWGSGKSSIINLTIDYIKKNVNSGIKILEFNPWNFSNKNKLILEFFNEIETLFTFFENDYKFKRLFKKYKDRLIDNSEISLGLSDDILKGGNFLQISTGLSSQYENNDETLNFLKKELDKKLEEIDYKILVIIDNIDRLTDKEIQQIFQLVNSLVNFPNMIYLLAFDKNVVIKALNGIHVYNPEEYIEKIIQVAFDIPKARQGYLNNLLINDVNDILKENCSTKERCNGLIGYFNYFIKNIRDEKRYCNTLNFLLPINYPDIYIEDFLLISLLNLFEHEIYEEIRNNKILFTQDYPTSRMDSAKQLEKDKEKLIEIFNKTHNSNKNNVINLIYRLFPKINFNNHLASLSYQEKDLRICFAESFDNYFALNLENHDVSSEELEEIFVIMNKKELVKRICNINKKECEKIPYLLNKFENFTNEPLENKTIIFQSLMDIGDNLWNYPAKKNSDEVYVKISRILTQIIFTLKSEEDRFILVKESIENVQYSIFTFMYIVNYFCKENIVINGDIVDRNPISNKHVEELKIISSKKICELNIDILLNNPYLNDILIIWSNWDNLNEYWEEIGNKIIQNDEYIIKFIESIAQLKEKFITNVNNPNDYNFNFETVQKFIAIDKLNDSLLKISEESLDKTGIQYKDLFLEEYAKKINKS